jgi:hypothetical protein
MVSDSHSLHYDRVRPSTLGHHYWLPIVKKKIRVCAACGCSDRLAELPCVDAKACL